MSSVACGPSSRCLLRRRRHVLAGLASASLLSGVALPTVVVAQSTPYSAGDAAREAEQAAKYAPQTQRSGPLALPGLVEPQLVLPDGEKLYVCRFAVKGGDGLVDKAALEALLKPYEGRKLTLQQIYAAADAVTALYREAGYLVAKAYVPEQDARGGTLRLKMIPGRYGSVTLHNDSLVEDWYLRGIFATQGVTRGKLIRKDGMERAMLLMSDLSGAAMPRAQMGAGQRPETSDFLFEVPHERRIDGFVLGDNFGSPYTGRWRGMAGANANSLLGIGDRLSVFGMVSDTTDLVNGRLSYAVPLGYDGLRAEAAIYRTTYALGGAFKSAEAEGVADGVSGTLAYPLLRSREDTIVVSGGYSYKRLDDRTAGFSTNERNLSEGTLAINRDAVSEMFGVPFVTSANVALTFGDVDYPDPDQAAYYAAGAGTVGSFQKIAAGITMTWAVAEKLSLIVDARGQKSLSGNLDSSEQFGLTGVYGVRSYNEGLTGDTGWLVTPELKYALPDILGWQHAVSAFGDFGGVALEDGSYTSTQPDYVSVSDIGVGYYGAYEYEPGRMLLLKAYFAHTISADAVTESYDRGNVGLVQAGFTF